MVVMVLGWLFLIVVVLCGVMICFMVFGLVFCSVGVGVRVEVWVGIGYLVVLQIRVRAMVGV